MKRWRIVGASLIAALAMGALGATAQAAGPEYGQCLAQKKGEYTNASCTTKAAKPKKGKFEWHAGVPATCVAQKHGEYANNTCTTHSSKPKKGKFERQSAGFVVESSALTLGETPVLPYVLICKGLTGTGEITGAQSATTQLLYEGCEAGPSKCQNAGLSSGTIKTPVLASTLVEPLPGEILTRLESQAGPTGYSYEFECPGLGLTFRVSGESSGVTSGDIDVMAKTNTVQVRPGEGVQGLLTEFNNGGPWLGPYTTRYEATSTTTFAANVEIRH
jgi:hypothetical protein